MGSMRLAVMPHWRAEVRDVAGTVAEVAAEMPCHPLDVRGPGALVAAAVTRRRRDVAVLCSDTARLRFVGRRDSPTRSPVFRLWWNTPDEIEAFVAQPPPGVAPLREHHVSFFPEAPEQLGHLDLDIVEVPYAFSPPTTGPPPPSTDGVWYAGEVDISDSCFSDVGVDEREAKRLSDESWQLADEVVAGQLLLVDVDARIDTSMAGTSTTARTRGALLWSLRNRVRYRLLESVVDAFPGRVTVRGSDWARAGFDALPTSHNRKSRMAAYRSHRVSLDLGSKSSHALLSPRVADILAAGGGLAQFSSGHADEHGTALAPRRATSGDDLLGLVDRLLSASNADAAAEAAALHESYREMRQRVGRELVAHITARAART
jgi:hypothetical protein